jgi:predicted GH43/DUF377 family glycosyl hydrolase
MRRCLLTPDDVAPSRPDVRVIGVFNPAALRWGDRVVVIARVAEAPVDQRDGFYALPRWDAATGDLVVE